MTIRAEVSTAFVFSGRSESLVLGQSSPGVLVFSRSLQLQYVNRRALELIRNIGQAMTESGVIVLSRPLIELRDQIQESLDDRLEANIWDQFEMSRVVSEGGRRLLLRGFGHPNGAASRDSRIIIVLEEIGSGEKDRNQQMYARIKAPEMQATGAGLSAIA
ncbi:MAG: hypothetical protein KGS09_21325 [Nitrospirae bacterium]|nr:hypothetical protein [Nitrospirota bacterium]